MHDNTQTYVETWRDTIHIQDTQRHTQTHKKAHTQHIRDTEAHTDIQTHTKTDT